MMSMFKGAWRPKVQKYTALSTMAIQHIFNQS